MVIKATGGSFEIFESDPLMMLAAIKGGEMSRKIGSLSFHSTQSLKCNNCNNFSDIQFQLKFKIPPHTLIYTSILI